MDCKDYYSDSLTQNGRKNVRAANNRYTYQPFTFQDHVADVADVNHSMLFRGDGPMHGWYTKSAEELVDWFVDGRFIEGGLLPHDNPCPIHRETWYGAFDAEGKLMGYCNQGRLNNLGATLYILRHGDSRCSLNGLLAYMAEAAEVQFITYHTMTAGGDARQAFKESTGFHPVHLEFVW